MQLGDGGTTGSLATSSAITLTNGNLTINRSNAVTQGTDFSGAALSGSGSFTQAGSGTTTFNVANTYTGATIVNAGTLIYQSTYGSGSHVIATGGCWNSMLRVVLETMHRRRFLALEHCVKLVLARLFGDHQPLYLHWSLVR